EGQKVLSVELAGQPELNFDTLLPVIQQRANEPFSGQKVDATIAGLRDKGYQAVEVDVRPDAEGIRVLFVLQPALYFGIYDFPEATHIFGYSPRGPYTRIDINNAQENLTSFFQQNGYFQAEVTPTIEVDKQLGVVNVVFHTKVCKQIGRAH